MAEHDLVIPPNEGLPRTLGRVVGHLPLEVDWFADGLHTRMVSHDPLEWVAELLGLVSGLSGLFAFFCVVVAAVFGLQLLLTVGFVAMGFALAAAVPMIGLRAVGRARSREQVVELSQHRIRVTARRRPVVDIALEDLTIENVDGWLELRGRLETARVDARNYDPKDVARVVAAAAAAARARQLPESRESEAARKADLARLAQLSQRS